MGLMLAQQPVMLRAVVTKNKPAEMLALSPKGTVPVLLLEDGTVIDESLDIMLWALQIRDESNMLMAEDANALPAMLEFIERNDRVFKPVLEKYKLAKRKHDFAEVYYRKQCEIFIADIDAVLSRQAFIMGEQRSLVDYAVLPFIRQFARVDRHWYLQAPYPHLRRWLTSQLQQPMFTRVMAKFPLWLDSQQAFLFAAPAAR